MRDPKKRFLYIIAFILLPALLMTTMAGCKSSGESKKETSGEISNQEKQVTKSNQEGQNINDDQKKGLNMIEDMVVEVKNIVETSLSEKDIDHSHDDLDKLNDTNMEEAAVSVDLGKVIQNDFLGVNSTYHAFALTPENLERGMSLDDFKTELERVGKIGLKIARTWYRPDWTTYKEGKYSWDTPYMVALCKWLEGMKALNVDVALQAGWWFVRDTYEPFGDLSPDPSRDIPRYTDWVSQSLNYLINEKGFSNIKYLILFTEPTTGGVKDAPEGLDGREYYVEVVKALDEKLKREKLRHLVKFVGPNNSGNAVDLDYMCEKLKDIIDIFSGHNYNLLMYDEWKDLCDYMQAMAATVGKPVWLDEYGMQNEEYRRSGEYGNYLAQAVAASINAGNQTSLMWILFDQLYVYPLSTYTSADSFSMGVQRWGTSRYPYDIPDTIDNAGKTYPSWYAFSMMSRYLGGRNGTKSLATTSAYDVVIAATQPNGKEHAFLIINTSEDMRKVNVSLSELLGKNLYRYMYEPEKIPAAGDDSMLPCSKIIENVQKNFTVIMPPKGVAIFTTSDKTVK